MRKVFAFVTSFVFIFSGATAASANSQDWAERVARALVPVLNESGAQVDLATAEASLARTFAKLDSVPLLAERLPPAMEQGAILAQSTQNAASRAVFGDLLYDMLWTAADTAGEGLQNPLLAAWEKADPVIATVQKGQPLRQSDLTAFARLQALGGSNKGPERVTEYWQAQAKVPVNRVFPTRLQAWAAGAEANWSNLSDKERSLIVDALENKAVPPKPLLRKVIGTEDMIGWLAAVNVPMSKAERKNSPDLVHFMNMGAFAGPLKKPLMELIAAAGSGAQLSGAANQLMRLNNWSAMTGEMHSWDSYRYMTQGY